ncbi:MAG: hypothetical protein P8Y97_20380 [Candidatus Lokiarchaeota archaeon]
MLFDNLNKKDLKNLVVKNWMTHDDGAWFLNTYLHFGIKQANNLNKKAIKTLSKFEVNRIRNLSEGGNTKISTYEELKKFIDDAFSVLKGDFMDFTYSFPRNNCIHWEMGKCFAYKGMKKLGIEKEYECGVIYRVSCWLKELGLKHNIEPKFRKCLLNFQEECKGDIIISFQNLKDPL